MIRKTEKKDLPQIMQIIREAQESLKKLGISQWQNGYPNEEAFLADMEKEISYVLEEQGQVVATAAISFAPDPTYHEIYEGEWLTDGTYGVIHRIAVKEDCKRAGYAEKLVRFAEELAGRQSEQQNIKNRKENRNKKECSVSLRIDTHEGNLPMRSFLKKQGFTECGIIYLSPAKGREDKRIAYEKKTS